ncbi:MAG: ATP-grasp domain-containing protein [Rubrivivax sp.]
MIAIAALSARPLAVWAAADGAPAIVLDAFGDLDTRRAAAEWHAVRAGDRMALDGPRLLATLAALARRGDVEGWVAGGGFDEQPGLLQAAAETLPLFGTPPAGHRLTRDAPAFFALLDRLGTEHPPVSFEPPPAREDGWLLKHPHSAAGLHVSRWQGQAAAAGSYWQRECAGQPMSATFVANGDDAALLGLNHLLTAEQPGRPFVFRGAVGPVAVPEPLRREVEALVRRLARECGVKGLASLDFIEADGRAQVLELNARPSATASLYPRIDGVSPLQAHLRACRQGWLPVAGAADRVLRGLEVVYARRALLLSAAAAQRLADAGDLHDLPGPGSAFEPGDPLCTIEAPVDGPEALARRRDNLLDLVEGMT